MSFEYNVSKQSGQILDDQNIHRCLSAWDCVCLFLSRTSSSLSVQAQKVQASSLESDEICPWSKSFCILFLEIPGNGECQSEQERKRKRQRKRKKRRYWGIPWHICFRSSARAGSCSYGATPLEGLFRWLFSPDGATCNIDVPVPGPFSWELLRDMGMSDIHSCMRIVLRKCTFKLSKLTIRVYCSKLTP